MSIERVPRPPLPEDQKQYRDSDISIQFTDKKCEITGDDDTQATRALMSCGHAVDPNALTAWCRSLLDKMQWEFYCPAIVDGKEKQCKKKWPYEEVRRLALLNEAETKYFEAKMSEYAAKKYCDVKECPGCRSFVEREDLSNLRVKCIICTKKNDLTYEFCWNCDAEWSGPVMSAERCGKPGCQHPDLEKIRNAPLIQLLGGKIQNVPSRRACPNCGYVVEHDTTGCKYMTCTRCCKEYCFACLDMKEDSQNDWYSACSKRVAPVQTRIPVWNRTATSRSLSSTAEGARVFINAVGRIGSGNANCSLM